jgi:hypothetical protein
MSITSPLTNLGPIVPPDLRSFTDTERDVTLSRINKVQIGTIQAYDPSTQSVTVQLVMQCRVYNTPMDTSAVPTAPTIKTYPLMSQVPVFMLAGGSSFIGMPIQPGDTCIVLFNDRDIDNWWTSGTTASPPNSDRMHSLSDGIAIVGINSMLTNLVGGILVGLTIQTPVLQVNGNLDVSTGATDTFVSADGSTVTVVDGIVVNIDRS